MSQKTALVKILRTLASAIDNLDEEQLDLLIAGKARIAILPTDKPKGSASTSTLDQTELISRLSACSDREQARAILMEATNKDVLTAFAKTQKIYVAKHDRRDDIENKIIEFIVGAKLRTEAIQTLNMKGGGDQSAG
jgi:hypothetical protein